MKTKNQVLAIPSLTAVQKRRAEAIFSAQTRFGKAEALPVNTNEEVKAYLDNAEAKYQRRVKNQISSAQIQTVKELLKECKRYGIEFEQVTDAISTLVKAKKNAAIEAKIAELQAQLIK